TRSARGAVRAYRLIVGVLIATEGQDASATLARLREARTAVSELSGERATRYEALFTKLEQEVKEMAKRASADRLEKIRARLSGVKEPRELEALVQELAAQPQEPAADGDPQMAK